MKGNIFKTCPMCSTIWPDRREFILDQSLEMNGYQANFENLDLGLFYFTHRVEGCYSTLAVEAKHFTDLHEGPRYTVRKFLTEPCPRYCESRDNLKKCEQDCECAFIRDLIGILETMKKQESP